MGRWDSSPESHYEYTLRVVPLQETNKCIPWPFATNKDGYGVLWMPNGHMITAHRLAYKIMHGVLPMPLGRHSCNNPVCFNWRHIIAGDVIANVNDRTRSARGTRGETHNTTQVTEAFVRKVRTEYVPRQVSGKNQNLARKYGVSKDIIQDIVHRRTWKHVK